MRGTPSIGVMAAGREEPVACLIDGMRNHGFVLGENLTCHVRIARGDPARLAGFAQELVALEPDLIAVIGAVTARAVREVSTEIPVVYAVVVDPPGDGLATASGGPLLNMTGVTTFDPDQAGAQIELLRAVRPDISTVACLADEAVSDCLVDANARAAADAGMAARVFRINGSAPDLHSVFEQVRDNAAQALVMLEQPALGVHAGEIAERATAQKLLTIFPLTQAGAGGLLSYGTSLGEAAGAMAWQASRILGGDAAINLPIRTVRRPALVVDLRTAARLGIALPQSLLVQSERVIQ